MADGRGFLDELKRRHVWRVAIAYALAAWLVVQVATQVFPFFKIPDWTVRLVVILIVIGFPVAVGFSWVYELTPEGIRRTAPADSDEARQEHAHHDVGRKLNAIIFAVLVLAVGLLGWRLYTLRHAPADHATVGSADGGQRDSGQSAAPSIPAKSIAVLPFDNLSSDKDNAYFADGIQDLILTKLADIRDLKVISRTSTEKYKSRPANLKQVAAELGVATILEGSVQKSGNQVLVNVQLIDAATDAHIWARSYTRTLDNVFGVEGEVAEKIAAALQAKLSPAETAHLATSMSPSPAANDLFLRAEYQVNRGYIDGDTVSMKLAIPLYRQAVGKDPGFAQAWARLSYIESRLAFSGGAGEDVKQLRRQARADVERALQLQPDLAAAHLALGYCYYWGQRDYAAALKAFAVVLAQRPGDADALAAQAYVQRRQGRFDDAIASFTRVVALDPRHFKPTYELGVTYMVVGRYTQAGVWLQRALALEPESPSAKSAYSFAIVFGSGDIPRALAVVQGDAPALKSTRANLLTYQRKYPEAIALLESIPDTPDNFPLSYPKAAQLAEIYWHAGDKARARPLFAQALVQDRARLTQQQDAMSLADTWDSVAWDELRVGHTAEALAAAAKSQAILAKVQDSVVGPLLMLSDAELYGQASRADLAVPLLAKVLGTSGVGFNYSPVMLWLDPNWDPIRQDPRFQALLTHYAKYKPAVTYEPALAAAASKP